MTVERRSVLCNCIKRSLPFSLRRCYVLSDLFVIPEARRRGVGTRLLKSAVETARAAGAVRVELATAITNVSAQRLYESLGWQRDEFYQYGLSL